MGKPIKVADKIYLVGSDQISGTGDCCVYAIGINKNEICLIDAGTENSQKILSNIEGTPLKERTITNLILTHFHYDHIGAAHEFRNINHNLKIFAHKKDAIVIEGKKGTQKMTAADWYGSNFIPVKVDKKLKDSQGNIDFGLDSIKFFHTPGHTPGSISLMWKTSPEKEKKAKKILFGQDIHGPFMETFKSNIKDWKKSMKMLLSLEADILCEGHYGIYRGKQRVEDFINSHLIRH